MYKEHDVIKRALEKGNKLSRIKNRIKEGNFDGINISDISELDSGIIEEVKAGAYRQILRQVGVSLI